MCVFCPICKKIAYIKYVLDKKCVLLYDEIKPYIV